MADGASKCRSPEGRAGLVPELQRLAPPVSPSPNEPGQAGPSPRPGFVHVVLAAESLLVPYERSISAAFLSRLFVFHHPGEPVRLRLRAHSGLPADNGVAEVGGGRQKCLQAARARRTPSLSGRPTLSWEEGLATGCKHSLFLLSRAAVSPSLPISAHFWPNGEGLQAPAS